MNAPWGYGKTTFLKMLHAHLLNNGFKVVRFNAWESDYIDDPFVALLTDTEEQLKVLKSVGDKSLQNKLEKVKNYGKKIIKTAVPAAVRVATAGVLDLNEFTEESIADAAERFASEQINAYLEAKKSISSFREEIKSIAE